MNNVVNQKPTPNAIDTSKPAETQPTQDVTKTPSTPAQADPKSDAKV